MKKIIVLLILLFGVSSCGFSEDKKEKEQQNAISQESNEYIDTGSLKVKGEELNQPIDTASPATSPGT